MHRPNNIYAGKQTAYLDHNILNYFSRYPNISVFFEMLADKQVVYSDETLREIRRSQGGEDELLRVLTNIKAMHLKVFIDEHFDATDDVILTNADPYVEYGRVSEEMYVVDQIAAATQKTLRKFYGDKNLNSVSQLAGEQNEDFERILSSLVADLQSAGTLTPDQLSRFRSYATRTLAFHMEISLHSTGMMLDYVKEGESGIKSYRERVGIGPKELNNISAPNIIEKIWKIHKTLDGYRGNNFSIEDFLGISYLPTGINGCTPIYSKVIAAYNVLNVIGYWNDSDMKRERRFISATSDSIHASLASYAHTLYSSDVGMLKKASAIYEFLGITTTIIQVNVHENK